MTYIFDTYVIYICYIYMIYICYIYAIYMLYIYAIYIYICKRTYLQYSTLPHSLTHGVMYLCNAPFCRCLQELKVPSAWRAP